MSKKMICKEPHERWVARQQALEAASQLRRELMSLDKDDPARFDPKYKHVFHKHPRQPITNHSRWELCNSFSNYDHTRPGPDPIDTVIDRLGVFEIDFAEDIRIAEQKSIPTTWVDRTGTPEYRDPSSTHYPAATKYDFEKIGVDIDDFFIFDSADMGPATKAISNFVGVDPTPAETHARREYGYELVHIQRPGQILNYHYDTYHAVIKEMPELAWQPERLRRFCIFMDDWKPGHIWVSGNATLEGWKKGECITWEWIHMPHGTANISHEPRYSLHLTGFMTEKTWKFYKEGHVNRRYVWNGSTFEVKDL
jgi:hypothetical protein